MQLNLSQRKLIAEDTAAFWFRPDKRLKFIAGQFGEFSLKDPVETDEKGDSRTFSIASDPSDDEIMVATRMRNSAFKRSLWTMPLNERVQFMGPVGRFTLQEVQNHPAIFLAGGIGITPVRSIVAQATRMQSAQRLVVIYSNRTRAAAAFHDDFIRWSRENPSLIYVPTLTTEQPTDWQGELGVVDAEMLRRKVANFSAAIWYLVGPPGFVNAMKEVLQELGIDTMQIRSEDFAGY